MQQSEVQETGVSFNPALSEAQVRITPAAEAKMAELFKDTDDDIEAIRVYVSGGGCGGMSYGMTFTDSRTPYDRVRKAEGFNIYVDSVAFAYLEGVEIDYVERPTGASFVFNNVFASTGGSGVCGACGARGGGCA
jgi:iron-sulfur cluster insertion protein